MKYIKNFKDLNESMSEHNKDLLCKYIEQIKFRYIMENHIEFDNSRNKVLNNLVGDFDFTDFKNKSSGLNMFFYDTERGVQDMNTNNLNYKNVEEAYGKLMNGEYKLSHHANIGLEMDPVQLEMIIKDKKEDSYEIRYAKFFEKSLKPSVNQEEVDISCSFNIMRNECTLNIGYIFKNNITDIFKEPVKVLLEYPSLLNYIYNLISDEDFYEVVNKYPEDLKDNLKDNALLKYIKHSKMYNDPERYEMEKDSDCYVLSAKDVFKEDEDGKYTKDLEIETIIKIDPYDKEEYGSLVSGMKLRSRFQEGLSVYIIWVSKNFDLDEYDDINSDDNITLRKSIREKMVKI